MNGFCIIHARSSSSTPVDSVLCSGECGTRKCPLLCVCLTVTRTQPGSPGASRPFRDDLSGLYLPIEIPGVVPDWCEHQL
jgi:hypothetical protein